MMQRPCLVCCGTSLWSGIRLSPEVPAKGGCKPCMLLLNGTAMLEV